MDTRDDPHPSAAPNVAAPLSASISQSSGGGDTGADAPSGAPAPGGAAAPLLDIGCGNVPHEPRKPWSRKQWVTRRTVLDRLSYWQANGFQCLWLTLTSSPSSSPAQIRQHFQTLRKRIGRQLGFENVRYVCVDTREGHGVLHIILAWKAPEQ